MPNITYLRNLENYSYISESVIPFKGTHTYRKNTNERFMYVYVIHCIPTNEWYVGKHVCRASTTDPLTEHYKGSGHLIEQRKHQYDWSKYFTLCILEFCPDTETLLQREQFYIRQYVDQYGELACLNCIYHNVGKRQSDRIQQAKAEPVIDNNTTFELRHQYYNRSYISDDVQPFAAEVDNGLGEIVKRFLYVYKITCLPTGNIYIGQHCSRENASDPLIDTYKGQGSKLRKLIQQYNWDQDFIFEIVEFCHDYEELDQREAYYIKMYKGQSPNLILNTATETPNCARDQMKRCRNTEEYKQKQRKFASKNYNAKKMSDAVKQHWRDPCYREVMYIHAKINGERRKQYYKDHPEVLEKIGREHSKALTCLTEFTSPKNGIYYPAGTIFPSTFECAKMLGYSHKRSVTNFIVNHKTHPMEWWAKVDGQNVYITKFVYVSDLTEDQKQKLNIV